MSEVHFIVGAGPVGRHLAALLVERGHEVVVATRSGRDTGIDGVHHVAIDAADAEALTSESKGAAVLYNCANPTDYTRWAREWPPLAASMIVAAERTGAVYAATENLYAYGPVDVPMHEGLPEIATDSKGALRARLWAQTRKAHNDGRIRAVQVRGSDYIGPGVGANGHLSRVLPKALEGKNVTVIGSPDQPHTFTYVNDVARTLAAAAADPTAYGRSWHVPSNAPRTQRQALTDLLATAGRPPVKIRGLPPILLRTLGLVSPLMREVADMSYQWTRPYVLDDSAARQHFGLEPTPWEEICRRSIQPAEASVSR
ncbi:NAD-dependent epimerase/dehydratase family protein [Kineosporia babensis]|uniref:NAD-dependent epimerase/dehydratase family protein n=1 Tax=Kineosporia babensis TaxID=499548 RepID=A0A9X1NG44_9ACTN|nr:NAD-dependent epimerase/dehydratase family protein [Kineosporia babensis]MCD5312423.1 NAD-dependent epimerase/dehydratase family protein [Kineosporia babensis]